MRRVLFILGQLNDSDVEWLCSVGKCQKIAAGTELIREGSDLDTMYFILDGEMSVWSGGRIRISTVTTGDILGEISLVDSSKTSASVKCETASVVLAIPKQTISNRLKTDIGFAARFYKALALFLAGRMRHVTKRMGYGNLQDEAPHDDVDVDQLDEEVLDKLHLAGARFERILQRLMKS
ncbi:MAG: cyclic nucleotide-binding domain-containing protein [Betaproteobacteria bacterium]